MKTEYTELCHGIYYQWATGRLWHPSSDRKVTNEIGGEAEQYAASLSTGDLEWRLPNRKELLSLVDDSRFDPSTSLIGMISDYYWSASTFVYNPAYAWFVYFSYGNANSSYRTGNFYVRCLAGPVGPLTLRRLGMGWRDVVRAMIRQTARRIAG